MFPGLWPSPTPTMLPELMDRNWLTNQPCRAPCGYGLEIGKSTIGDAQEKLSRLSSFDSNVVKQDNSDLLVYCKEPNSRLCASLSFENETLSRMIIYLNYKITLKEVVDIIGPPDSLSTGPNSQGGAFITDCRARFYWIDRQMEIIYMDSDSYTVCKKIENAGYKPMSSMVIHQIWIWEIYEKIGIPWSGFAEEN